MGYQPLETPAIKHPPGNSTFFCGKCNAPLAREDVHALSWEDKDFSCSACGTLFSHTPTCTELWGKFIRWCARFCLRLKYSMDVDDYYRHLVAGTRKSHSPLVFESPYIGKQNMGDRDTSYYPQGQSNTALLALMKGIEQEIEAHPISDTEREYYHRIFPLNRTQVETARRLFEKGIPVPHFSLEPILQNIQEEIEQCHAFSPQAIEPSPPMDYYPTMEEDENATSE